MATSAGLAIETEGLVKSFGNTRAVDGIALRIPPGGVHGFLGPNGAGKTTTIRILATLLRRTAARPGSSGTTSSARATPSARG